MNQRQLLERESEYLHDFLKWPVLLFRLILFILVAVIIFLFLYFVYKIFGKLNPLLARYHWWIIFGFLMLFFVFVRFNKQITNSILRKQIKRDLRDGKASIITVNATDAIKVLEYEDEGPAYVIKTDDNKTIVFSGQYLLNYQDFPWTKFEVVEAPRSEIFLGLNRIGEPFNPSVIRQPFNNEEIRKYAIKDEGYTIIDVNYEEFKMHSRDMKNEGVSSLPIEKLYYHGTSTEVKLGDQIIYKTLFGRKMKGTVWYLPGVSPKHPEMEYDNIKYWAVKLSNSTMFSWVYLPRELKVSKRISFVSRAKLINGLQPNEDIS